MSSIFPSSSTNPSSPSPLNPSTGLPLQTVSGLASGLDTSSIVSALMAVAQQPELRIKNQITVETARQTAYNAVLTELNSLTTSYQALTDVSTWAPVQTVNSSDPNTVTGTLTGGAAAGAYEIQVTQLARANQFTSGGATSAAADDVIHITNASGTTDVKIASGDSLTTIASKITTTAGSPVYATVLNGNLVLSNKQTGTANAITGVTTNGTSGLTFSETQTAKDAAFTIDGNSFSSGTNVDTTALAGVTLTLSGKTTSATTITVGEPAPDTAGLETKLNAFVTEYNSVLTDIQSRLSEQPLANPTSDADRAKGVLYNDQGLERLLSNLRNAFSDTNTSGGAYASLAQVGLSTGAAVGQGSLSQDSIAGKLTVNTGQFETALNANFDAVKQLFTHATGSYSTEGLGQRLNGIITPVTNSSLLNGYLGTAIQNEAKTITDLQSQVTDWDQRLALKQQMYQSKFTAMETALSQSQSIAQQLTGQIAQLP
jgi:flagellar hook-associated protein 2